MSWYQRFKGRSVRRFISVRWKQRSKGRKIFECSLIDSYRNQIPWCSNRGGGEGVTKMGSSISDVGGWTMLPSTTIMETLVDRVIFEFTIGS